MSTWRREAISLLPELKAEIEGASSQMAMWIELHSALEEAYSSGTPREELIGPLYSLVLRAVESKDGDTNSAVACAFLEHLPLNAVVWADLHRWLPETVFKRIEDVFKYHVAESEFSILKKDYLSRISGKGATTSRHNHRAG